MYMYIHLNITFVMKHANSDVKVSLMSRMHNLLLVSPMHLMLALFFLLVKDKFIFFVFFTSSSCFAFFFATAALFLFQRFHLFHPFIIQFYQTYVEILVIQLK